MVVPVVMMATVLMVMGIFMDENVDNRYAVAAQLGGVVETILLGSCPDGDGQSFAEGVRQVGTADVEDVVV